MEGSHLTSPEVSPDGSMLAGLLLNPADQRGIWTWSFATRKYERIAPGSFDPHWVPGSSRIVLTIEANQLVALDVVKKTARRIPQPVASFDGFTIAPDGRALYLGGIDSTSALWVMR